MNKVPTSNLLLTDVTSGKWFKLLGFPLGEAFYQSIGVVEALKGGGLRLARLRIGQELVAAAEFAHAFRDWVTLDRLSGMLIGFPLLSEHKGIGVYFRGLVTKRMGTGNIEESNALFQRVIGEPGQPKCKARAILSLAANAAHLQDWRSELELYVWAWRAAGSGDSYDPSTIVSSSRAIAVWKARDGSHRAALSDLEKLFPLARSVGRWHPHVYYDYLNSLAVEMANNGRLTEARNASRIVLASPFAPAYPEWRETYEEISLKLPHSSRSIVGWSELPARDTADPCRVLPLRMSGALERNETHPLTDRPAPVVSLAEWREPSRRAEGGQDPAKLSIEEFERMSLSEKKEAFVELLLAGDSVDESKMDAAFRALSPNDRLMLLVDLILGPRGTDERVVAVMRCLLA